MFKFPTGDDVSNQMFKAIYTEDTEKVENLIDTLGFSHCPDWIGGYQLLLTAIQCNRNEVAKLLIRKGSKLDSSRTAISGEASSVCHKAIIYGDDELICLLLQKYPEAITKIEQGDSLLHLAVMKERTEIVKVLLERKADIESRSGGGMTPLHLASVKGNTEIVHQLMTAGADLESRDSNGKSSLFLAVSSNHKSLVETFLSMGANVNCRSKSGLTPLLYATNKKYIDIVRILLDHGAQVTDRNSFGQTALHIACMVECRQLINMLLEAASDINAVDCRGMVPCDAIVKRVSNNSLYFEDSTLAYLVAKHFILLKVAGFYLNPKNAEFYKLFFRIYCDSVGRADDNEILLRPSNVIQSTVEKCMEEIEMMKTVKSDSGFTVYNVLVKFRHPLSVVTECELSFLRSINLNNFATYKIFIESHMRLKKKRNDLLLEAEERFCDLLFSIGDCLPSVPEELGAHIMSFLTSEELEQFIHCFYKTDEKFCQLRS